MRYSITPKSETDRFIVINKKVTAIMFDSLSYFTSIVMQQSLEEIKENLKGRIEMIFYNVWNKEGLENASKYNLRVIPTILFLMDMDWNISGARDTFLRRN